MAANVLSRLAVVITANTAQMVGQLGTANKKLGLMTSSLNTLKNTMLGTFGAYAVLHAIQNSIKVIADFDKEITAVKAITGTAGDEFNKLRDSALALGSATQYSAKQVAGLQVEFARLGFSSTEILQSTKATIDLATATGEDLVRSAEIAGATLRAFQLDASEMNRVTDVMASSLNESALTLDSFGESMKFVAPVSKAANVSLEETTAILSVLSDAGLKGSIAGTGLRRILSLLAKDGKSLTDRLSELRETGITLKDASDEAGLLAQTQLLVIANQVEQIEKLTKAYGENQGATERLARIMEDNLATSLTKVGTAWDSLILSFEQSDNLQTFFDKIAIGIRKLAGGVGALEDEFDSLLKLIDKEAGYLKGEEALKRLTVVSKELGRELRVTRDSAGNLLAVYEKLNEGFPDAQPFNPTAGIVNLGINKQFREDQQEKNRLIQEEKDNVAKLIEERKKQFAIERAIFNANLAVNDNPIDEVFPQVTQSSFLDQRGLRGLLDEDTRQMVADLGSAYETTFTGIVDGANNVLEAQNKMNNKTLEMRSIVVGISEDIGGFFGEMAAGLISAEQAASRAAAGIISTLKQVALARMIANQAKFGVVGIIAAAAGFGLVESLFRRIGRTNNSRAGSGFSSSSALTSLTGRESRLRVEVVGSLRGRDIEFQQVEVDRVTRRTKANG